MSVAKPEGYAMSDISEFKKLFRKAIIAILPNLDFETHKKLMRKEMSILNIEVMQGELAKLKQEIIESRINKIKETYIRRQKDEDSKEERNYNQAEGTYFKELEEKKLALQLAKLEYKIQELKVASPLTKNAIATSNLINSMPPAPVTTKEEIDKLEDLLQKTEMERKKLLIRLGDVKQDIENVTNKFNEREKRKTAESATFSLSKTLLSQFEAECEQVRKDFEKEFNSLSNEYAHSEYLSAFEERAQTLQIDNKASLVEALPVFRELNDRKTYLSLLQQTPVPTEVTKQTMTAASTTLDQEIKGYERSWRIARIATAFGIALLLGAAPLILLAASSTLLLIGILMTVVGAFAFIAAPFYYFTEIGRWNDAEKSLNEIESSLNSADTIAATLAEAHSKTSSSIEVLNQKVGEIFANTNPPKNLESNPIKVVEEDKISVATNRNSIFNGSNVSTGENQLDIQPIVTNSNNRG